MASKTSSRPAGTVSSYTPRLQGQAYVANVAAGGTGYANSGTSSGGSSAPKVTLPTYSASVLNEAKQAVSQGYMSQAEYNSKYGSSAPSGGSSGGLTSWGTLAKQVTEAPAAWNIKSAQEAKVYTPTINKTTGKAEGAAQKAPLNFQMYGETSKSPATYTDEGLIPKRTADKKEEAPEKETYDKEFQKMIDDLKAGEKTDTANPFEPGTEASKIFDQMKGLMNPLYAYSDERKKAINEQDLKSEKLIEEESALKQNLLSRQLTQAEGKKQTGIEKVRGRQKSEEMALEEGRKRALRYLKGSLAQRGALGTTGTGMFNLAALTGEYDIKNADLRQKANSEIGDLESKFGDIVNEVQGNQLLTETEKTKLLLELDKQTTDKIDSIMQNLANQEFALSGKSFDLAYQEQRAQEERDRQKRKELRDYAFKQKESGEYVSPELMKFVTDGDPVLEYLDKATNLTGRENITVGVDQVYTDMLGVDWASKMNPKTGQTYKDDSTDYVVKLINGEIDGKHWILRDALNRVRNSIADSEEYKKLQAAKFTVSGGSGSGGFKPTAIKYFKSGDNRAVEFIDSATGQPYWSMGGIPVAGKLPLEGGGTNSSGQFNWIPETNPNVVEQMAAQFGIY